MRRPLFFGLIASAVFGLLALSIGSRPRLKAEQAPATISSNAVGGAFGEGDPKDEPSPPVKRDGSINRSDPTLKEIGCPFMYHPIRHANGV
jgi:hypothetical protein